MVKKFFILAAIAFSIINFSEVEASALEMNDVEIVELGPWTKFRDHITGKRDREKREQYERERWERWERSRGDYYRHDEPPHHRDGHRPPPPPRHRW